MAEGTVLTRVKIDVNPDGIVFNIEGLDTDLARLIEAAGSFTVLPVEYQSIDTSNVTIRSDRALLFVPRPPVLTSSASVKNADVNITFKADQKWQDSISRVLVNGQPLAQGGYTVVNGVLTILGTSFINAGTYTITVKADNYVDAIVAQVIIGSTL